MTSTVPQNLSTAGANSEVLKDTTALAVCLGLFALIGTPGNILVIVTIALKKQMWKAPNFYILAFAFTDLISCGVILPFQVAAMQAKQAIPGCLAMSSLTMLMSVITVQGLCAIAINRYLLVVWSSDKYQKAYSPKRTLVSIVVIIGLSMILTIPMWAGVLKHGYWPELGFCTFITGFSLEKYDPLIYSMCLILGVGIPCFVVIIICYAGIWSRFRKSANAVHTSDSPYGRFVKQRCRLSRNLFILTIIFSLCWIPAFLTDMIWVFVIPPPSWLQTTFVLTFANSVINPFLYALLSRRYWDAYKDILRCKRRGQRSNTVSVNVLTRQSHH